MKTKLFLITLIILCGFTVSVAQNYSNYGYLIGSGTYTCTGIGFQGLETKTISQPFLIEVEIYEKAVIHSGKVYHYVGNTEMYFISGRKYQISTGANAEGFLVDSNGAPHYWTSYTQNLPFVGQITTTTFIICNVGDTRNAYMGGNYNGGVTPNYGGGNSGGTYNTQPRQKNCNHCHGTGICPNCNGSGMVVNPYGNVKGQYPCVNCNPNGNNPMRGKCPLCNGLGKR